jgi:protocatechuate 3,4-dioxygenase beta subunit
MKRRNFLKFGSLAATSLVTLNSMTSEAVEICAKSITPAQPKGPFYPIVDQIDTDADLVYLKGSSRAARGQVIIVEGVVTDQKCRPVEGALVEIWQACDTGRYNHPSDPNNAALDEDFQYWGKAVSDKNGFYRFRTILPGAYPADANWVRPPHIHFKISKLGFVELITQMYFAGQHLNEQDLILKRLRAEDQKNVIVDFKPVAGLPNPVGTFNIQIEKL